MTPGHGLGRVLPDDYKYLHDPCLPAQAADELGESARELALRLYQDQHITRELDLLACVASMNMKAGEGQQSPHHDTGQHDSHGPASTAAPPWSIREVRRLLVLAGADMNGVMEKSELWACAHQVLSGYPKPVCSARARHAQPAPSQSTTPPNTTSSPNNPTVASVAESQPTSSRSSQEAVDTGATAHAIGPGEQHASSARACSDDECSSDGEAGGSGEGHQSWQAQVNAARLKGNAYFNAAEYMKVGRWHKALLMCLGSIPACA
jgi:hypothetical protein